MTELDKWKRRARVLQAIVQEDHPDELVMVRGMREWCAGERRKRRAAETDSNRLQNLLAVIHGDGGHHTGKVGLERSCLDARDHVLALGDENRKLRLTLKIKEA